MGIVFDYFLYFSVITEFVKIKLNKKKVSRTDRDIIKLEGPSTNKKKKRPQMNMSPCWGSQFMGGLRNAKKNAKPRLEMT